MMSESEALQWLFEHAGDVIEVLVPNPKLEETVSYAMFQVLGPVGTITTVGWWASRVVTGKSSALRLVCEIEWCTARGQLRVTRA